MSSWTKTLIKMALKDWFIEDRAVCQYKKLYIVPNSHSKAISKIFYLLPFRNQKKKGYAKLSLSCMEIVCHKLGRCQECINYWTIEKWMAPNRRMQNQWWLLGLLWQCIYVQSKAISRCPGKYLPPMHVMHLTVVLRPKKTTVRCMYFTDCSTSGFRWALLA